MYGQPVWLASMSRRSPITRRLIPTGLWSGQLRTESAALLRRLLGDGGDARRERLFRMQATLCLQRAISGAEVAALPASFHEAPAIDLAGGPVEVLWESEVGAPSTQPCANPGHGVMDPREPLLWVPIDCGSCASCVARTTYALERGAR